MKWKCPLYNQNITRHRKKQEHTAYSQEKSEPTETTPGKDPIADRLDQDFKTIILKKLKDRKMWRKSRKQCGNKTKISVKRKPKKNSLLPKTLELKSTIYCCSAAKSCPPLCNPMNYSRPGFPVLHYLPEFAQIHVQWVSDAIQPSHPASLLLLPSVVPSSRVSELPLHIKWSKCCSFSFSVSPSNEYSGLISLGVTGLILLSEGLSRVFSSTTI